MKIHTDKYKSMKTKWIHTKSYKYIQILDTQAEYIEIIKNYHIYIYIYIYIHLHTQ